MNNIKRYQILYDSAAQGYTNACEAKMRSEQIKWKKRMNWLDKMLSEVESHFTIEEASG